MKEIKITESEMHEALAQLDTIQELSPKENSCLRLLTEEMYSMCAELLKKKMFDFEVKRSGNQYSLCISVKTRVKEEAREEFLSLSSSGKNAANKGIKGMMGAVLELFLVEDDLSVYNAAAWAYGMQMPLGGYTYMWSLSQYMLAAPPVQAQKEWDGIEKSIIASFADDVSIGVRHGKLEMTVTKAF